MVALLVILSGIAGSIFFRDGLFEVFSKPRCVANMRSIHTALSSYTQDHGYWPQIPEFTESQEREEEQWWIDTLKPYDITQKSWICPSIARMTQDTPEEDQALIHYSPTQFDAFYRRAYQWETMPWLIEIADAHGQGAHMAFPDGSVRTFNEFVQSMR